MAGRSNTSDTKTGDRPLLEVRGLSAGYGAIPILHGLDFVVRPGETVGVLGHNGMGKSTLLKTLMGYRSEEHTSELQSLMRISYAVFCLKKKKKKEKIHQQTNI